MYEDIARRVNAGNNIHSRPCNGECMWPPACQVVGLLEDNLAATPEQLGDAAKETKEELADRHERALAASLLAIAALADVAAPPPQGAASDRMAGARCLLPEEPPAAS